MSEREEPAAAPLVEYGVVGNVYASGLAEIEDIGGGCLRFVCYVNARPAGDPEAPPERVVVAKIVAPVSAVPDAVMKMIQAVGGIAVTRSGQLMARFHN